MKFEDAVAAMTEKEKARLADTWVYVFHQRIELHGRIYEVSRLSDGVPFIGSDLCLRDGNPWLFDDVTADGLPRTAKAIWRDETLYAIPMDENCWAICQLGHKKRNQEDGNHDILLSQAWGEMSEDGLRLAWLKACLAGLHLLCDGGKS